MVLDIILEGSLPHDFVIFFNPEQMKGTYYGQPDIVTRFSSSGSSSIQNRDIGNKVKSGIFCPAGAGTARLEKQDNVLVLGSDKANITVKEYGPVHASILNIFRDQLLQRYQEIYPIIMEIRLEPDESATGGNWNLDQIVKALEAQARL